MIIRQYHLNQSHDLTILTGKGALKALPRRVRFADYSSVTFLSDDRVALSWLNAVKRQLRKPPLVSLPKTLEGRGRSQFHSIIIPHGERSKNIQTAQNVLAKLHGSGIGRDGLLIALGGGVVGDIAGFVASIYKRGIDYIQIPTSLIAMTDSAIGGKTGVDFAGTKNSIGTFYQPRAVVCDPVFLETLPRGELINGMAEVIKYGIIADRPFFDFLSNHTLNDMPWEHVVEFCAQYKANIVARDERDIKGLRALLNFGHTVGHAVEAVSNYRIPHGHGVAIGMTTAARVSSQLLGFSKQEGEEIERVLKKYGLPTRLPAGINIEAIMNKIGSDKKSEAGRVKWVLLKRIGKGVAGVGVEERIVRSVLEESSD